MCEVVSLRYSAKTLNNRYLELATSNSDTNVAANSTQLSRKSSGINSYDVRSDFFRESELSTKAQQFGLITELVALCILLNFCLTVSRASVRAGFPALVSCWHVIILCHE